MNYNELKNKYHDFIIFEKESHSIKLNISNFRIDNYRGNHDEFVQYLVFILLRVKEANIEKKKFM